MSCNQRMLLQRLAVEEPEALKTTAWQAHLADCPECRHDRYALGRSVAVFRQFESQPGAAVTGPSWETFSRTLAQSRRRQSHLRVRVPLAAASLLVAVSSGVLFWPVSQQTEQPQPARIVTLQPVQEQQLQHVLRSSLQGTAAVAQSGTTHESPAPAQPPAVRFDLRSQDSAAMAALPVVEREQAPSERLASESAPRIAFGRPDSERAPVLLFRSLQQQQRGLHSPIQVMPVFAPVHRDPGGVLPRALLAPLPIR